MNEKETQAMIQKVLEQHRQKNDAKRWRPHWRPRWLQADETVWNFCQRRKREHDWEPGRMTQVDEVVVQ